MPLEYFDFKGSGVSTVPAMHCGCTVLVGTGATGGAAKHAPHTANRAHDKLHLFNAGHMSWFSRNFANSRRGMIPPIQQPLDTVPDAAVAQAAIQLPQIVSY